MNSKTREVYDFGDTGSRLMPLSNFAYILHETRDPLLAWLAGLAPGKSEADFEFAGGGVRPEPPGDRLPPVKLFRDVGTAVFRSGFDPDDFAFIFRAGPFFNHQHFDQGSFYLADRGQNFLVEGGRTDYYNDPWYQGFFIQPGAHNCLLVDENVESQRAATSSAMCRPGTTTPESRIFSITRKELCSPQSLDLFTKAGLRLSAGPCSISSRGRSSSSTRAPGPAKRPGSTSASTLR